ncbi:MAG TPA: S8 family serine peptidase [Tepidisphaeraceae bacterium]
MSTRNLSFEIEPLENRQLLAWSSYAQLVHQDTAAANFSSINGSGQTVALIDTGIDYNLPMLGGGFGKNFKVVGGFDFADNDSDPMDSDGHGTDTASVIAATPYTVNGITYQGVAPAAKLVALRVGTADNIPNSNIDKALKWVITNYKTYNISVVNLSLGSGNFTDPETESGLSDDFAKLRGLGIFVTAASGNSNDENLGPISQDGIAFPAADPNVFAVGAVDSNDVIADWAQRSKELDLLAPGVNIVMPKIGGGFVTEDGTSFSSPYVAGTAALIKQETPTARAGDIGSILMSSGVVNRDGDKETGNTTGLLFSRLDINAALSLANQRVGATSSLKLNKTFDTALDSQGVLHAAFYDTTNGDLLYATRATNGLWSKAQIIDSKGDVGAQMSIAVDATGHAGIGYFDSTNTAIKYASFNGTRWSNATIESEKHVGTSPSLGFDIDGNAYLAYYRRTSGSMRLATMNRDTGRWMRNTVDGLKGANVGADLSLDVGEAAIRSGAFTQFDTTVAIAYADSTNGDLKYARLDVDDPTATWFMSVVDNTSGVGLIDLDLHDGFQNVGTQAQIAYQDVASKAIKYAYRNTNWFVEKVTTASQLGGAVQLSFDSSDNPAVTYYDSAKRGLLTVIRSGNGNWSPQFDTLSASIMSVSQNDRTGDTLLTFMNRTKSAVKSSDLTLV